MDDDEPYVSPSPAQEQPHLLVHLNRTFTSPDAALAHYRTLCESLQRQLNEANADIQDYTESSKELQDELEKELARMEKGEREMRKGLEEARGECEDWKVRACLTEKSGQAGHRADFRTRTTIGQVHGYPPRPHQHHDSHAAGAGVVARVREGREDQVA